MCCLVSIIIPVYNAEFYLKRCLDSVVVQTYQNIEVILIDDGSVDKSSEICDEYKFKDNRFVVIHNKYNKGVSAARNTGVDYASGKYICFIDSDDFVKNNYVEILCENMKKGYEMVCCNYLDVSKYGNVTCKDFGNKELTKRYLIKSVIKGTGGVLWNKMFVNDIIINNQLKFDESLFMCEDLIFILTYIQYVKRWLYIDKTLYIYNRLSKTSVSSNINYTYLKNYELFFRKQSLCLKSLNISSIDVNEHIYTQTKNILILMIKKTKNTKETVEAIKTNQYFKECLELGSKQSFILNIANREFYIVLNVYNYIYDIICKMHQYGKGVLHEYIC